jgi:aspartyl protease family protein
MAKEFKNHLAGMGKGMLTLAWLIALALLTLIFGRWEERQINPNSEPASEILASGIRQVTLEANRFHHYVSNGSINGRDVVFLLDTGATDVVIPEPVARKLGLKRGAARYAQTANGTIKTFATRLNSLQIGSIELKNVRASINPHMKGDEILLGMSALKQVELIQSGNTLTLRQLSID